MPDAMMAPTDLWPPADGLALDKGYEPDPFQKHAILGIHAGDHVFVTAKTGSGKTFVGEYLIARALAAGQRVFYTTPIKSLSNQKYHDLKVLFPNATVGILTGDIKMAPDAQIVVMTAEILRNLFYKRGTATEHVGVTAAVSLEGVAGVVMDEVHYIQDPDRGHVWEESLILAPRNLQLVLLSATMPSAAALAGWLGTLHQRRVWLLSTTYRIVPLVHGLLSPAQGAPKDAPVADRWRVTPLLDGQGRWIDNAYTGWIQGRKAIEDAAAAHKRAVAARRADGYSAPPPSGPRHAVVSAASPLPPKVRVEDPIAKLRRTVDWLGATGNLPALFFVFSRKECERLARLVEGSLIDASEAAAAEHIMDFHLSRHRVTLERSPQYHRIRELLIRGIAFHHSGLQPLLKEIVEILFTRGFVKALFATETFSVGLNMPTKTVVFLEMEKWCDGGERRLLRPDEYIQMAGRAGRRGIDDRGLVLYEPLGEPVLNSELKGVMTGALSALQSRMRFHYDFILKHHLTNSGTDIAADSYWAVQQRATRSTMAFQVTELDATLATMELTLPLQDREALAEREALEEAVATSGNAARKRAAVALKRWGEEHSGSQWDARVAAYKRWKETRVQRDLLVADIAAWDSAPLLALEPQEECLSRWGFLKDNQLTELGLCASDTNEGHCILMPLLAASGRTEELTAEEIACVLAGFLREGGGSKDNTPHIEDCGLSDAAISTLYWVDDTARELQRDEDSLRVFSPTGFWDLSPLWVSVTARWIAGDAITVIAAELDLFEGNVLRGLLRVANLLEEWGSIATIRNDLATLEKLRGLTFLRGEVVVDSLYLRL